MEKNENEKLETLLDHLGVDETKCDSCSYFHTWGEVHPYGSTTATEWLMECRAEKDEDCPRLEDKETLKRIDEILDPFGKTAHDKHHPDHSGENGHECVEWDFLYICKDCPEHECCSCK